MRGLLRLLALWLLSVVLAVGRRPRLVPAPLPVIVLAVAVRRVTRLRRLLFLRALRLLSVVLAVSGGARLVPVSFPDILLAIAVKSVTRLRGVLPPAFRPVMPLLLLAGCRCMG